MITKQQWAAAVLYCKGLSGLSAAPDAEYLKACYAELQDKFTSSDDLHAAAVAIAANEQLFGQYPPLRLWLKYCPYETARIADISTAKRKWLTAIMDYIQCDPLLAEDMHAAAVEIGGAQGYAALQLTSLPLDYLRRLNNVNGLRWQAILDELSKAWDIVCKNPDNLRLSASDKKFLK